MNQSCFGDVPSIASIRLRGYPYEQELQGQHISATETLSKLADAADYVHTLPHKIVEHEQSLQPLYELGFHGLDTRVKSAEPLTYEEAFSLATYVCLSSNMFLRAALESSVPGYSDGFLDEETVLLHSISLLQAMSTREAIIGLAPQEIAGLVAATLELDTVVRVLPSQEDSVFAIGGMGGDRGYTLNGQKSKLFNLSTLSTLALQRFGMVHKHHSYPNTSKIGGQSAIEAMGARSDFNTPAEMQQILGLTNGLMSSCHSTRTLHTISHRLKGETINHVIGPIAFPHDARSRLHGVIGVNHNVHPESIIESLAILHEKGVQHYDTSVAFCGLNIPLEMVPQMILDPSTYYAAPEMKRMVALDEVAPPPYATLAAFLIDGKPAGTYVISPADFLQEDELSSNNLFIPNTADAILRANAAALSGQDEGKMKYLAMSVALALFTKEYATRPDALDPASHRVNPVYMHECYLRAKAELQIGAAEQSKTLYVEATQKDMLPGIDAVIFDIDNTLVKPNNPDFYRQYSRAVERAIARFLGIPREEAVIVADFYRQHYGGGEQALLSGTIAQHFPEYGEQSVDTAIMYEEMDLIDPVGEFIPNLELNQMVQMLRAQGKRVIALTDSPEGLSRRVLSEVGIDPDNDFDHYLAFRPETGPRKNITGAQIFQDIAESIGVDPTRILSIGDSLTTDVLPARSLGMHTCLLSPEGIEGYSGLQVDTAERVFAAYRKEYYGN